MRWLLSNVRNRLSYAAHHPGYAVRSLLRELTFADEQFLSRITGCPVTKIRSFLDEPLSTPEFAACLRGAEAAMRSLGLQSADLYAKKILAQYATIRAVQPETVVETGVANGVSSSYLLLALAKNNRGKLYSVEVGDKNYLPKGKPNGWIVPDFLRQRWEMRFGDSKVLLPALLKELQRCDVFIHDSLHTYDHMLWEFREAYPFLRDGGLLFADDALWNDAFWKFKREVDAQDGEIIRGVGYLRKEAQARQAEL